MGCNLAFDNFFSSVQLLIKLHAMGIRAVATIRVNRKDLPKLKEGRLMEHGEVKANISTCSRLSLLQWKDKRCVNVISNYISPNKKDKKKKL